MSQSAASSRVESLLRAYGPASSQQQNGSSAVSMAAAAGISVEPSDWGSGITVEKDYRGPHVTWPLTKATVESVLRHIRTEPDVPLHPKYVAEILGRACMRFRESSSVHDMQVSQAHLRPSISLFKTTEPPSHTGGRSACIPVLTHSGNPSNSAGSYTSSGSITHAAER